MYGFFKRNNVYQITLITETYNIILGITFDDINRTNNDIQVLEMNYYETEMDKSKIRTSKKIVLDQVRLGLDEINADLKTEYKLAKIYFSPFDESSDSIYSLLICILIKHYHNGKTFYNI